MILGDMSNLELKAYAQQLSYMTYDFNLDYNLDIKPIAKAKHISKNGLLTTHSIPIFIKKA